MKWRWQYPLTSSSLTSLASIYFFSAVTCDHCYHSSSITSGFHPSYALYPRMRIMVVFIYLVSLILPTLFRQTSYDLGILFDHLRIYWLKENKWLSKTTLPLTLIKNADWTSIVSSIQHQRVSWSWATNLHLIITTLIIKRTLYCAKVLLYETWTSYQPAAHLPSDSDKSPRFVLQNKVGSGFFLSRQRETQGSFVR